MVSNLNTDRKRNEELFEFASFLLSSSRGCLEEGTMAASLRLLDALSRLPSICPNEIRQDEYLAALCERVSEKMNGSFLRSSKDYVKLLDDLMKDMAQEICARNGLR